MNRLLVFVILTSIMLCAARGACAQMEIADNGVDDRLEALLAVIAFRADLMATDSVRIADCRIAEQISDEALEAVRATSPDMLVSSAEDDVDDMLHCGVYNFAYDDVDVFWVESVLTVTKSGVAAISPARNTEWEIQVQLLRGPGQREFHTYHVAASLGFDSDGDESFFDQFRVVGYQFRGVNFHWADGVGHSSFVGRGG